MRMKIYFLILLNFRLAYSVICEILIRHIVCKETRRKNKFWNVKQVEIAESIRNVEWYLVYFFWSLGNMEGFSAMEKKIDVKNVWNDIK